MSYPTLDHTIAGFHDCDDWPSYINYVCMSEVFGDGETQISPSLLKRAVVACESLSVVLPGYLPAPDHNGDTSNDRRLTELADEMAAVRFFYTVCLEAQELSVADGEMFRLVAKLATEAAPSACQDLSEVIQKVDVVRTMDRYIRENNSERAILDELTSRTNDIGIFRVHAHLGDYAGALCSLLKKKKTSTLSRPWTSIVPALDRCDELVASWKASGSSGAEPSCPEKDEIVCYRFPKENQGQQRCASDDQN